MHMPGTYSRGDRAGLPGVERYEQSPREIRYITNQNITKAFSFRNCASLQTLQYHPNFSKQAVIYNILTVHLTNGNGVTSPCMGSAATYSMHAGTTL